MGLRAVVLGASGFSGGELMRLLLGHPFFDVVAASAGSRAGQSLATVQPHLAGLADATLSTTVEAAAVDADVCFSAMPSGALDNVEVAAGVVVDLSDEHRGDGDWVYGLTEYTRASLKGATRIANPGCYPTASLLAVLPFVRAGLVEGPIVVDAMSGVSGAGRKPEDRLLFSVVAGGAGAYGSTEHRHVPEMERSLARFGDLDVTVSFTPHLIPIERGLIATVRARLRDRLVDDEALHVLRKVYDDETFVHVLDHWPSSKAVAGSNHAHVTARVDARNGWLIASAAIDNLGKGAAGQAIQNANIALGLHEEAGLSGVGVWP
jgi:N-acetyl-gamma-glutamyl-phosphate reductase